MKNLLTLVIIAVALVGNVAFAGNGDPEKAPMSESMKLNELPAKMEMYPNPNRGDYLIVHLTNLNPQKYTDIKLEIKDASNEVVFIHNMRIRNERELKERLTFDLKRGMYAVHVTLGEKVLRERLIVR